MTFQSDKEVLLLSWKNKKVITVVSTMHSAEMVEVLNIFGRTWMKPDCVADCNTFMQEVRKTDKWPKKEVFCLPHCALFNSFQAFVKPNQAVRMGCLDFVKILFRT